MNRLRSAVEALANRVLPVEEGSACVNYCVHSECGCHKWRVCSLGNYCTDKYGVCCFW